MEMEKGEKQVAVRERYLEAKTGAHYVRGIVLRRRRASKSCLKKAPESCLKKAKRSFGVVSAERTRVIFSEVVLGGGLRCSAEIENGVREIKVHLQRIERDCRICRLSLESTNPENTSVYAYLLESVNTSALGNTTVMKRFRLHLFPIIHLLNYVA
ncbi:hypothetical protein LOK49_LG13G02822 [Camellia lanceoleosa]|uniref:Uncharacterized protein n=1 Tax=Camellia lanceoleosa TaxID=1840588 RepID=A0ACC0FM44_9ERIC|nr:hypothetical protein LOK49_LG13G02822 [Camellia lanceoleosa]